jgi:rhodanese-related sulfurtransferase
MSTSFALDPNLTMSEVLSRFPSAQRALFQRYHIGGCSSCGFRPDETLAELCERNGGLPVADVAATILEAQEVDARIQISPRDAQTLAAEGKAKLVDVRTREEFDAVHIPGSHFLTQELMHELGSWDPATTIIFVCHHGVRSLDAAAYFAGHGLQNVRSLNGGIDAWSCEVDETLPRYELN